MGSFLLAKVIHTTHIFMTYLAGHLQLVAEAFYGLLVRRDFRFDEFEGDFFLYLFIFYSVDFTHASFSQLFDDFVSISESSSSGELFYWCFKSLCV
ncbi:hypothetical protein ES703_90774 [subsurface metagenome]